MKVIGPLGKPEKDRDPTWFTPEETIAKLGEGYHNKAFIKEQRHLVRATLNMLGIADKG